MKTRYDTKTGALLLMTVLVSACAPTTPRWDSSFGNSVRASIASQVINPASAGNTNPVNGIDGSAALGAHQQYSRSYAKPAGSAPPMAVDSGAR